MVGYFIDKKLHLFMVVKNIANQNWGKFGLVDVLSNEKGFCFFQLDKEGVYRQLLKLDLGTLVVVDDS